MIKQHTWPSHKKSTVESYYISLKHQTVFCFLSVYEVLKDESYATQYRHKKIYRAMKNEQK